MRLKKILLARPNLFIVNEMKSFITECNYEPTPVADVSEFDNYNSLEIGGVVISTAISSSIKEDYQDVVKIVKEKFPNTPVLLATLVDYDRISANVKHRFEDNELNYSVLTMEEASDKKSINNSNEIVVIQKSDLVDKSKYGFTLNTAKSFFS